MNLQNITDKAAIGFSLLCGIHCLMLPVLVVLLPSLAAISLDDELFHRAMLFIILPTSLIALTMGCRKHKRYHVFAWGAVGLTVIVLAAIIGHDLFGEWGEKVMTMVGAIIIATGHVRNYRLCQSHTCEEC